MRIQWFICINNIGEDNGIFVQETNYYFFLLYLYYKRLTGKWGILTPISGILP